MAMRMMGEQFVTGETIDEALANARALEAEGFRYSYDMLGEAALTAHDADALPRAYEHAIHAIGRASRGRGIYEGPGISIKLSALHPRYSRSQHERVMRELYPRAAAARDARAAHDIGLNIDAEEADRLELSLDLLERLCVEPGARRLERHRLRRPGLSEALSVRDRLPHRPGAAQRPPADGAPRQGRVLGQRDQARAGRRPRGLSGLHAQGLHRRLLPRLRAQAARRAGRRSIRSSRRTTRTRWRRSTSWPAPIATRRASTSSSACTAWASRSTSRSSARSRRQARTVRAASTRRSARTRRCSPISCAGCSRTAPTRRSSTASPIASFPIEALVEDPVETVERMRARRRRRSARRIRRSPLPRELYGAHAAQFARPRSGQRSHARDADAAIRGEREPAVAAAPMLADDRRAGATAARAQSGRPRDVVGRRAGRDAGRCRDARSRSAVRRGAGWAATAPAARAALLDAAPPTLLEADMPRLLGLLVREAGKTYANAIAEVREAVDFLRFYAPQVRARLRQRHAPCRSGPVVCISPWNFPLAIFIGQIAAALAAGNPVLAKPAEQTPLVAAAAVRICHARRRAARGAATAAGTRRDGRRRARRRRRACRA